jgi:hypothetical protein
MRPLLLSVLQQPAQTTFFNTPPEITFFNTPAEITFFNTPAQIKGCPIFGALFAPKVGKYTFSQPALAVALAVVLALASRYPKASALGLSTTKVVGFSPWGMPSYTSPKTTSSRFSNQNRHWSAFVPDTPCESR